MNEAQDQMNKYDETVAKELGINVSATCDIVYLRGRSGWAQEKENYLILLAKTGKEFPFIMEDFDIPKE